MTASEDIERIGRRQQLDPQSDRLALPKLDAGVVVLGSELDPSDVAHPNERAVATALHDDPLELFHLGQATLRADTQLIALGLRHRRLTDAASRHLDVLLAQRVHNIAGRQPAAGKTVGIEPQAHRVLALAEDNDVADARDALDRVPDQEVDVVAHEQRVVPIVVGIKADSPEEPGRVLSDRNPIVTDDRRHPPLRLIHPVLHVDRRQIWVSAHLEEHGDRGKPCVRARRGHVGHALHAVDDLLERRRDGTLHRLCVGARIECQHGHRRRG